jgi:hypothetical protein
VSPRAIQILSDVLVVAIWIFFLRVIRAVWVEVRPPRSGPQGPASPNGSTHQGKRRKSMHLKVLEPASIKGRAFALDSEATIGRGAGCAISLDGDRFVSTIHARVFPYDGEVWIEDLGSTNGTYVNAERVQAPTALRKGDIVQVGGVVMEVTR